MSNVDAHILVFCLGLFVLLYSIYSLLPVPEIKGGASWAIISGGLGGLVGALFGTGGPFYVVYLKIRQLDKSQFRATIASILLIEGSARIVGYTASGLYTPQALTLVAILLPVLLIGMYIGHYLHIKIDQKRFKSNH